MNGITMSSEQALRVMVVDDDLTCETLWVHIFERIHGKVECEWATSVSEAIKKIEVAKSRGNSFDLVIVDIFLSGSKTGFDLWEEYHEKLGEKMILVSSVDAVKVMGFLGGSRGLPEYLQKPFIISECLTVIRRILGLQQIVDIANEPTA